jgi:3-deoxy-D-arabino-heptulosonate 7-phosphate (DAHP) synthase class II
MKCGWCEEELEDGMERWRVKGESYLFCTRDCAHEWENYMWENSAEPVEVLLRMAPIPKFESQVEEVEW